MPALLTVPPEWPMMWQNATDVRAACPACGEFHLYVERPANTVECRACGLNGVAAVQRAFNRIRRATPPVPQELTGS